MNFLLKGIETERILFREIDLVDFSQWIEFFKDPHSFEHWKGARLQPELECSQWYEKQFNRYENNLGGMNALVERTTGELIGHAGLLIQKVDGLAEVEIAYSLMPDFRNKGFATEAAKACKLIAFERELSSSLISIISLTNSPSANVAIKNGMQIEKQTWYNQNRVNIFRVFK